MQHFLNTWLFSYLVFHSEKSTTKEEDITDNVIVMNKRNTYILRLVMLYREEGLKNKWKASK